MPLLPGVYEAKKKDGTVYYRASITYQNKHISLGSYTTEDLAHQAYKEACSILNKPTITIDTFQNKVHALGFQKWVVLVNFRDNKLYIKNPIYIMNRYFIYYINKKKLLKFDVDDLFYYSTHKIMNRGGHLFVSDYGSQVNILSRYGIKNYAVPGRDYKFANGDPTDYRYGNIEIINRYHGVTKVTTKGLPIYLAKIHINGDTIVGRYPSEIEAAIAYNKAAALLKEQGVDKEFYENYIGEINEIEYARIYHQVRLSRKIRNYQVHPAPSTTGLSHTD